MFLWGEFSYFLQLLSVSAAVLGNLCVAYVMNSETDEVQFNMCVCLCTILSFLLQAEELMKKIEKEEVSNVQLCMQS